jgi:hypothetical protein
MFIKVRLLLVLLVAVSMSIPMSRANFRHQSDAYKTGGTYATEILLRYGV